MIVCFLFANQKKNGRKKSEIVRKKGEPNGNSTMSSIVPVHHANLAMYLTIHGDCIEPRCCGDAQDYVVELSQWST